MSSLKYDPGLLDNVENREKYVVGGFHPVHLGDTLDNGRYRIVHKLAMGASQMFGLPVINVRINLTPRNVLYQLTNLDTWSEEEVYERLGQPYKDAMSTSASYDDLGPSAPTLVVEPIADIKPQYVTESILIIDFGQSFFLDSPPSSGLGTPWSYRAPEAIFDLEASVYSDIWALGCIIFEIRAGEQLFEAFWQEPDEILDQLVRALGKLPEPWWQAWDGKANHHSEEDLPLASSYSLQDHVKSIGSEDAIDDKSDLAATQNANNCKSESGGLSADKKTALSKPQGAKLSLAEVASLYDLLSKMLKYESEERMTAEEVYKHPGFTEIF